MSPQLDPPCSKRPPKWGAVVVISLAGFIYLNSLGNDFVYDDKGYVINNEDIRHPEKLTAIFSHDVWGWPKGHTKHTGAYRPIVTLSFAFNYILTGLRPASYHFVNIAIHVFCSYLVYIVGNALLKNWRVSLLAAILFASHPVHTESVTAVYGRPELLAGLFFFSSLRFYLSYRETHRFLFLIPTFIFYFFGILSKESVITLPGVLIAIDCLFPCSKNQTLKDRKWVNKFPAYIGFVSIIAVYLILRYWMVGSLIQVPYSEIENPMAFASPLPRWLTNSYLLAVYARLLLFPIWLSVDYSFNQIPLIESWSDSRNLWTLIFIGGLSTVAIYSFRRNKVAFFGLLFTGITFVLTSNIFIPIGTVLAERLFYVPLWGFCLFLAAVVHDILNRWGNSFISSSVRLLLFLLILFYSVRTIQRTFDWRSDLTLWKSAALVCPNSIKVNHNLGVIYAEKGTFSSAENYYRKALEIRSNFIPSLIGLAGVLTHLDQTEEAVTLYNKAAQINPRNVEIPFNKGIALQNAQRFDEAISAYRETLTLASKHLSAHLNLGYCLEKNGDIEDALQVYRNATKWWPNQVSPLYNMLLILVKKGELVKATRWLNKANAPIKKHKKILQIRFNLALSFLEKKDYSNVVEHFEFILLNDPSFPNRTNMRQDIAKWKVLGY